VTGAHIIAIGGLGMLALLLLYARALNAELPESVCDPVWNPEPGGITWVTPRWFIDLDSDLIAQLEQWKRRDPDPRDLLRWADDGGPA
jgi:hypothetical protein